MSAEGLNVLFEITAASSLAVLVIGLMRKPVRRLAGARIAYGLWLLMPSAIVAALVPAPSSTLPAVLGSLHLQVSAALPGAAATAAVVHAAPRYALTGMAVWIGGAMLAFGWLLHRQSSFVRSLQPLKAASDGTFRSAFAPAPMLVGLLQPRIVVPDDFERRYNRAQRELMLVHERTHLQQHDPVINALASAWLAVSWFNPLMHLALSWLRIDQELACDALVLALSGTPRRRYAEALLKTQLTAQSLRRLPAGCAWQSHHPLKERIAMLRYPLPGVCRRLGGNVTVLILTLSSGYAVWAGQPAAPLSDGGGTPIAVRMKWLINGVDVFIPSGAPVAEIKTTAGHEFVKAVSLAPGRVNETRCTVSLPKEGATSASATWDAVKASGQPTDQMILFQCQLISNGRVFAKPALLVSDGKTGTIEATDSDSHAVFRLELTASSSHKT